MTIWERSESLAPLIVNVDFLPPLVRVTDVISLTHLLLDVHSIPWIRQTNYIQTATGVVVPDPEIRRPILVLEEPDMIRV